MISIAARAQGFEGVRVVECAGSGIAAAYAGWLLAQMGAQVTRLVGSDPTPPADPSPQQLAIEVLGDGKACEQPPASAEAFHSVLADCDVLLCDSPPSLEARVPRRQRFHRPEQRLVADIDLSQIEALLGTLRPYLVDTQVRGRQTPTMGNAHPELAPHGIYPAAREIKHRVEIPVYGSEDHFKAPWRFSDFAPRIDRCGPLTGEHDEFVFGEVLGLAPQEIAELKQSGVVA